MDELNVLIGKTITSIIGGMGSEELLFKCDDGTAYRMHHWQDCCEHVELIDIIGEIDSLIDSPIVMAECIESDEPAPENVGGDEAQMWTFYKFATVKGYVTFRWFGSSNGYYSIGVDFQQVDLN